MEFKKRKYSNKEVEYIFNAYQTEYKKYFIELKKKINTLSDENRALMMKLSELENKNPDIQDASFNSDDVNENSEKIINRAYALELARIKNFSNRWNKYFLALSEKYPLDEELKVALDINSQALSSEQSDDNKSTIEQINKILEGIEEKNFNPRKKILDYLAATGDNGFNMDEVLNPGQLELGDLCKELGLMEENE